MPHELAIDPKKSALMIMDFQRTIVEGRIAASEKDVFLARTAALIDRAHALALRVIYIVVGFRSGYPEASPNNQIFSAIRATKRFSADADPAENEIHPTVAPKNGDIVITKHRVSAFMGTDLEMILRANGVDTLILTGIATSGVVLSTLRHAADADYRLVVVKDCCSDGDNDVHNVLVEKIFPRQATVITADTLLAELS